MNLKAIFVLLLTVIVIFGYSFYRYFFRHEYTVSSSKHFGKEVRNEPSSMDMGKIKARTPPKASTKERNERRKETNDINYLPNTESEEKAKKEFLEQLDELSRKQKMNIANAADKSTDDETLSHNSRMKEHDINGLANANNTFIRKEKTGDDDEEDEIQESRDSEINITKWNQLVDHVTNTLKNNGKDNEETELVQQSKASLVSNFSGSFSQDLYNVTVSKNGSGSWDTLRDLAKSNDTLQQDTSWDTSKDLSKSYGSLQDSRRSRLASLNSKIGSSARNLRGEEGRTKVKKSDKINLKQKVRIKVKRTKHHKIKKGRHRSKKKYSSTKDNVHQKSLLHKEGHNGKRQQHRSIHPNKKMLANLKNNFKIDYREGYVLDQTFFREAKLKPVYNTRNRKTSVLLLHPSIFTSSVWVNIGTMEALASSGFRNIAIDLPGYGRSNTSKIPYSRNEIIDYMIQLLRYLGLEKPVIVTPSRSGDYVMPLIMSHPYLMGGFVAISPTDTGKYSRHFYEALELPSLVVLGKEDTSMLNWASLDNLEHLKMRRIFTIANATKECYVDRPSSFHKLLLDFLPSLSKHTQSS